MFKIIGGNGTEYGPVTADQIRQWIAEGRASGQTLAQAEGAPGWKPISAFPEFAGSVAAAPQPFAPPVSDDAARARAASLLAGPFIGLLITAIAGILAAIGYWRFIQMVRAGYDFSKSAFLTAEQISQIKEMAQDPPWIMLGIMLAGSIFILFGAFQFRRMRHYPLCIVTSVVALVPVANFCCWLGVFTGTWALVVLLRTDVKNCFK